MVVNIPTLHVMSNSNEEIEDGVELAPYLVRAAQSIRECGWISRATAKKSGDLATADHAYEIYRNAEDPDAEYYFDEPTPEDYTTAQDALAYVRTSLRESGEEFDQTLVRLVDSWERDDWWVPSSDLGYASSIILRYQRFANIRNISNGILLQQQAARSTFQGRPGQVLRRNVRIVRRYQLTNSYGEHLLTIMEDPNGNIIVFFDPDTENIHNIEEGHVYEVTGVIGRHDTVREVKETILASCVYKLVEGIRL